VIKRILLALLLVVVASLWWMASSNWKDVIVAPSPDGKCRLIYSVWPMFDLTRERISLECNGKRRRLWSHSDSNNGVAGGLTEVAWSADNSRAFVLRCAVFVEPSLLGWDFRRQTMLPQDEVRRNVAASLRIRYQWRFGSQQYEDDQILNWACSEEGRKASGRFTRSEWPYSLPAIAIQD
jgi:hypothetical protein